MQASPLRTAFLTGMQSPTDAPKRGRRSARPTTYQSRATPENVPRAVGRYHQNWLRADT
jgi:hypothetical protein